MNIELRVKNLIKRHETRDPFRIARELGILISFRPYENTKGYYLKVKTNKFIVINSNLDDFSQRVVCAHELGHALLHSSNRQALKFDKGTSIIQDFTLFPTNSIYENQANKFAAELLIHEDLEQEMRLEHTDMELNVYKALIQLKHSPA